MVINNCSSSIFFGVTTQMANQKLGKYWNTMKPVDFEGTQFSDKSI